LSLITRSYAGRMHSDLVKTKLILNRDNFEASSSYFVFFSSQEDIFHHQIFEY